MERNAAGAGYGRLSLTSKPKDVVLQTSMTCSESATAHRFRSDGEEEELWLQVWGLLSLNVLAGMFAFASAPDCAVTEQ